MGAHQMYGTRATGVAASEEGFTIIELVVSLTILSIGFLMLAGATSSGARLLVQGKQRQVATQAAAARIEHVRNIPYANASLLQAPTHSSDEGNPDYYVSVSGTQYDHLRSGTWEDLVVDTVNGDLQHIETQTVGSTALTIYQYITWVDDPTISGTQDYKRVSVVVSYSAGPNHGRPHVVRASTLLTTGTVTVGGSQSGATQGANTPSPTATPSPSPSSSPGAGCSGDTTAPSGDLAIISGTGSEQGFTASASVTVSLSPVDACTPITVQLSNDNATWGAAFQYDANTPTVSWALTAGDGSKSVWARFTDGAGNTATYGPRSITLDSTRPTVPGTLSRTVSCSGNNRTVNLSWGTATDLNLLGYRVYRNVNAAGYQALGTSATQTKSDTHAKTLNSVEFKVVAYDRAGNEGNPTNVISLSKNQCN